MRTQLLQNRAVQGQENLALASVSPAAVRGEQRAWSPRSRISARHISPPKKFRLESKGFLYVRVAAAACSRMVPSLRPPPSLITVSDSTSHCGSISRHERVLRCRDESGCRTKVVALSNANLGLQQLHSPLSYLRRHQVAVYLSRLAAF